MKILFTDIPKLLCKVSHRWEIGALSNRNGTLSNHYRECQRCGKMQQLSKPKKYHPSKLVWTDMPKPNREEKRILEKQRPKSNSATRKKYHT